MLRSDSCAKSRSSSSHNLRLAPPRRSIHSSTPASHSRKSSSMSATLPISAKRGLDLNSTNEPTSSVSRPRKSYKRSAAPNDEGTPKIKVKKNSLESIVPVAESKRRVSFSPMVEELKGQAKVVDVSTEEIINENTASMKCGSCVSVVDKLEELSLKLLAQMHASSAEFNERICKIETSVKEQIVTLANLLHILENVAAQK
uniref:Uncharacterized protein n=1 Tax=Ditylenchus dipsaci TaxID=166011 RepID=A0A915D0W7_9BILA